MKKTTKTTKKSQNPSKKRYILCICLFIAVAALVFGCACLAVNINSEETKEPDSAVETTTDDSAVEEPTDEEDSSEPVNPDETDSSSTFYHKEAQYEAEDPNTSAELTGSITYAAKAEDGSSFSLGTMIDQYLEDGSCELNIYSGETKLYSVSTNIFPDVASSYCNGFTVNASDLGGSLASSYHTIINLKSGDKTGTVESMIDL